MAILPDHRAIKEGWAFTSVIARKAHYFVERRSLCGNYHDLGFRLEPETDQRNPEDCRTCRKSLAFRAYHR